MVYDEDDPLYNWSLSEDSLDVKKIDLTRERRPTIKYDKMNIGEKL